MASRVAAVKAAQTLISRERPVKVDGIWGRGTDAAYSASTPQTKAAVVVTAKEMGWEIAELRPRANGSADLIIAEAKVQGVSGSSLANLLATVEAESNFVPKLEGHYYSDLSRARGIFKALAKYSDSQLYALRASGPRAWFEAVYGKDTAKGRELGNREPGDGYAFRGAGFIQLTGRGNFTAFARASGYDVVNHPELLLDVKVSAAAAVWYWKTFVMKAGSDTSIVSATNIVNKGLPAHERESRYAMAKKYMAQLG